jgi:hypothetical protein
VQGAGCGVIFFFLFFILPYPLSNSVLRTS